MALHNPEEDKRRQQVGGSVSTPAEGLTENSSDEEIRKAISASISLLVEEGFPQEQAQAIAINQAKKATGRTAGPRSGVRSAR